MSVALIRDGVIRPSENDSHMLTAMLPSSCPQNHAANILPLPDGALMCVWFAERRKVLPIFLSGDRDCPLAECSGAMRSNFPR